jgi:glycosyltransferase involved in cell wall biosynthesis
LRVPKRRVSDVAHELRRSNLDVKVDSYPVWGKYHAAAVATIMARSSRYDAVLTQNFCPPMSTAARVTLLHDALFVSNPEWFTRPELLYLGAIRPSLRRATIVLTTSVAETVRIGTVWPELRSRLATVGLSVPDGLANAQPHHPSGLPDIRRFVLAVGRLNVRKNLGRLVEAFVRVAHDAPERHLVIVGGEDGAYVPVEVPEEMMSRIHFLGHVTDEELRWLYENCCLFVSPSLGEGYGLPLIEASMFGAQVIASDIAVFKELDIACAYFDPTSIDEMAAAIRSGLSSSIAPRVGRLSWDEVAQNIREAIEKGTC